MLNSRPTRSIVSPSYVWLVSPFASDVSAWALSGGINITCCDVVERPVWDGSSLRDVARVPKWIRYRQRRKEGTHSARSGLLQVAIQSVHLEGVINKWCKDVAV